MADSVEVIARFGESVIDVAYVEANRAYRVETCDRFAVVRGGAFHRRAGIEAELVVDGCVTPIAELCVAIPPRGRIRARNGLVTLTVQRVTAPRRTLPRGRVELRRLGYLAVSIALHAMLWAVADRAPAEGDGVGVSVSVVADRGVTRTTGAQLDTLGGRSNHETRTPPAHAAASTRGATQIARMTRDQAIDRARTRGPLESIALRAERFEGLIATADLSRAFEGASLYGTRVGDSNGGFGVSLSGSGGGSSGGTIGAGRYATDGLAGGAGSFEGRAHVTAVPQIRFCGGGPQHPCIVEGDLDKAIIRRYLKRHLDGFQYCYEKERLARPALDGDLVVHFLIGTSGDVASASSTGFDAAVGDCVAEIVRGIAFPRAHGTTEVHYGFQFRKAGP